ncbi:hypothetical protein HHK36_024124 [Tetracentron sinense]|uniref:Glutathione S-transferase 3, mitochondrial n=1 Tax=Tetracentron sinense TaxID=13715 RepID=A0A834YKF2_TETSI|nr:hypothetical protein HHK36_024124 [Tetracentron sinense]
MAAVEFLPREFGYVVLVLVLYSFLNFWMTFQVGKARKKYKVFYPTLYALESENKDAKLFNCVQRGHQNSLEMMPMFFAMLVLGGLHRPLIAAGLGTVYTVARYFYFTGYATGDPQNRLKIGYFSFEIQFLGDHGAYDLHYFVWNQSYPWMIFVIKIIEAAKMAAVEFLPREFGYVVLVLVLYSFLNFWMTFQVGKARKKYKVFYPTLYALESENKDAKLFNCVQRGHQNSLEMMPMFFAMLVLGGLHRPLIAAGLGTVYTVARYFYFTGYATGDPQNRLKIGRFSFLAIMGLMICTTSFGINLILG